MAKHEFDIPQSERLVPRDLGAERTRQIDNYVGLGLHFEHGVSEEWYRAHIPQIPRQPRIFEGKLDVPLIFDPMIMRRGEALGLKESDTTRIWELPDAIATPYALWTHDAKLYLGESVAEAESSFKPYEEGATFAEVVALFVQRPEVFSGKVRNIYAPRAYDKEYFGVVYGLGRSLGESDGKARLISASKYDKNSGCDAEGLAIVPERSSVLSRGKLISVG